SMFPWVRFPACATARQNCFVCYAADKDETDETNSWFGAMGEKWVLARVCLVKAIPPQASASHHRRYTAEPSQHLGRTGRRPSGRRLLVCANLHILEVIAYARQDVSWPSPSPKIPARTSSSSKTSSFNAKRWWISSTTKASARPAWNRVRRCASWSRRIR